MLKLPEALKGFNKNITKAMLQSEILDLTKNRSSHLQIFFKIGVLKSFAIITVLKISIINNY